MCADGDQVSHFLFYPLSWDPDTEAMTHIFMGSSKQEAACKTQK